MYNGIGLPSARGSGTNGYVQKNNSYIRPRNHQNNKSKLNGGKNGGKDERKANEELLMHDRKREVEVKCAQLRETLEMGDVDAADIEVQVQQLRSKLMDNLDSVQVDKASRYPLSLIPHPTSHRG
jgi:serine/arginine repetitive matrix protein 2